MFGYSRHMKEGWMEECNCDPRDSGRGALSIGFALLHLDIVH